MAPSINSSANLRIPTDKELSRLADLARVPQETRGEFSDFIANRLLRDFYQLGERQHHNQAAVTKTIKAARLFKLKIAKLDPKDREYLVERSLEEEINFFLERAVGPHEFLRRALVGRRGRPLDTIKNREFRPFVLNLLFIAERLGGGFTFTKSNRTGTLIKAIELLRPYAPPGVVPRALSHSTIGTWKNKASTKNKKDRARMEKSLSLRFNPEAVEANLVKYMGQLGRSKKSAPRLRAIK
jgi:hypothetical protein